MSSEEVGSDDALISLSGAGLLDLLFETTGVALELALAVSPRMLGSVFSSLSFGSACVGACSRSSRFCSSFASIFASKSVEIGFL